MPVHDWTRVDAGIFHDFHHAWIEELKRELNGGLLPGDYYALAEQHAAGFGPDVLTLEARTDEAENESRSPTPAEPGGVSLLLSPRAPKSSPRPTWSSIAASRMRSSSATSAAIAWWR